MLRSIKAVRLSCRWCVSSIGTSRRCTLVDSTPTGYPSLAHACHESIAFISYTRSRNKLSNSQNSFSKHKRTVQRRAVFEHERDGLTPRIVSRRRLKLRIFLWTAVGISIWLCALAYLTPSFAGLHIYTPSRLQDFSFLGKSWLGRKLLSSSECTSFPSWIENGAHSQHRI